MRSADVLGLLLERWREHYSFRLEVAKKYADKEEIKTIVESAVAPTNAAMAEMRSQVAATAEHIAELLSALQIEIPAVRKR
jgi:hypothetical protein